MCLYVTSILLSHKPIDPAMQDMREAMEVPPAPMIFTSHTQYIKLVPASPLKDYVTQYQQVKQHI